MIWIRHLACLFAFLFSFDKCNEIYAKLINVMKFMLNDVIMMSSCQILDLRGIMWNLYFQKAYRKSYPNIQYLLILDEHFKSYGNVGAFWPLLARALSKYEHITWFRVQIFHFLYENRILNKILEVTKFCSSAASLTEVIMKTIWGRAESFQNLFRIFVPPPPPSSTWNRIKFWILIRFTWW